MKITDYVPEWRKKEAQEKVNLDKPKKQKESPPKKETGWLHAVQLSNSTAGRT